MKSSAARYPRKSRGAMFDEDEPSTTTPSSCSSSSCPSSSSSSSEAHSTNCHCHCPLSSRGVFEDVDGVPSAWTSAVTCDLCERLRGRTGQRSDPVDATRTENVLAVDRRPLRRKQRDENGSSKSDLNATSEKRDRTVRCDRVPAVESSARCASSVVRWNLAVRFQDKSTKWRRILLWIAVLILASVPDLAMAQQSKFGAVGPPERNGVCQSIDIRNNVDQFSKLEGCRVVEGFVQILLIDRAEQSAYANISFPDLVEITGYLVLYRVSGLRSVGHLFPNLAVIRGHSLFINYALVAFEMMHLQELGLNSLTNILRGSVRFEKNPTLCYIDTIDWDIIAKAGKGEHVILGNKVTNGCPVCDKKCPARRTKPDETLCWNRQHCQRICKRKCEDRACDDNGDCCHDSCLGGCTGPTAKECIVCKGVIIDGHECKDRCPEGTYEFMNRGCITERECRLMPKPREALDTIKHYPYKAFNGSCVIECPAGYMESNMSCRQCEGPCLKECTGTNVDSIASAQKLRGCTRISGSLEIQIRGGKNIVKELEDSLNTIEEINGYLKVVRSFPLISLNFLKNLRVIYGNELDNGKYSLAVFDNQNLQELWDWRTHPNISIKSKDGPAKIFFHFNPKLCLHKIETLREKARLNGFTDLEVAPNSNGDKVACNVTELQTKVLKKSPRGAIIEWEAFTHHDTRSLLNYVVYFIEAPNQNVTMYDGRDACGGDGWRVEDVSAYSTTPHNSTEMQDDAVHLTHILTLLKPYTQYAYYVKTYTLATERSGAQSQVKYFTTLPDAPSSPRALLTWSNSSSELVVSWFPPLHKNGNLTTYRIIGRWEPDDPNFIDQRNYCDEPMLLPEKKPISVIAEEERKRAEEEKELAKSPDTAACPCTDRESTDQSMREKEVSSSIAFENALHNQVYVKRMATRRRRDTSEMLIAADLARDSSYYDQDKKSTNDKMENGTYTVFERLVPSTNLTYVMKNLRHFAAYNIEVQACRERIESDMKKNCSTKSMKTYRTLALESADNIPANTFRLKSISGENNSLTMVTLSWDEPPQPNGLIVTYQIEYKRVDIKNIQATVVCITRRDFTNSGNSYILKDLPAGNYSVKVRATSLAGYGAYTEVKYFYIQEHGSYATVLASLLSGIAVLLFVIGALLWMYRKRAVRNVPSMRLIATVNPEYVSTNYVPDEWEVPRKKVHLLRELGNGSFGMVYEGLAKTVVRGRPEVRCAVKTVNENATDRERIEFLNEASVMKAFDTHHVVKLLGVVSQGQPTLVVMELMVNGDLKTYLRSHRPDVCENFSRQPPTLKRILQMATEIADGMSYLSAKKFVHRDLAARNCMVAEDLTVKIGDFGMTRDIYETDYYRKGSKGLLPVRWMAPESLKDGVFTSFSDVWSYGVVLWEMVTLASQPYQGLSNDQVLRYVIEGGVMERPENCPDSLYNLMRRTWNHRAVRRPTFICIETMLLQEINIEDFEKVSFYHSPEGMEARNQNNSYSSDNEDLEMAALQDLREEIEGDEDSPLRQDFGDFASFEPGNVKDPLSPRYDSYGETSKTTPDFHDINCSKIPLKAGFEDFDGVSGDSLSSKDTVNLPFVEDSLKSVKSSPFIYNKSASRGNLSQASLAKSASPQSRAKQIFLDSPNLSKSRNDAHYETKSSEIISGFAKKEAAPLHVKFPSVDEMDMEINGEKKESKHASEFASKPETLNNGYIGNTTT